MVYRDQRCAKLKGFIRVTKSNCLLDQTAVPRSLSGLCAPLEAARSVIRARAAGNAAQLSCQILLEKNKWEMFGAVSGELIRGSKSLGLEALQLHAVGRLMRLRGDVRGQARRPFLLLLSILLKYARHVIFHFLVTCADGVQLELPVFKTGVVGGSCANTK